MANAFLSYSHVDELIATRIAQDLRAAGVTVWIDQAELRIGEPILSKVGEAIDSADFLLVLLSHNALKSEWVHREIEVALSREMIDRKVIVLPLLVRECEIPPFLRGRVYADFRDPSMYRTLLNRVIARICSSATIGGTTNIVFDESYRQDRWFAQPVISAGYGAIASAVEGGNSVTSYADGYARVDDLPLNTILILPMPFGTLVDQLHYDNIAKWVLRGGRLLLLGLYLMEKHHYSNLNSLARRFGFDFAPNLTMPLGHEDFRQCMDQSFAFAKRDYWITTKLTALPATHPILEGVATLSITSSCTIDSAAEPDLVVSTAEPVAVINARGHKDEAGRLFQLTDYVLDKHDSAPLLIALSHGAGRVVGIGSWKVFLNELVEDRHNDNMRLFRNVITWFSESRSRIVGGNDLSAMPPA